MKYFLDCADFDTIKLSLNKFPLEGVTTNPAILARDLPSDMSLSDGLMYIRHLTKDLLLFVQATAHDTDGMLHDAHKICTVLGGKLSIKLPATPEGFAAAKRLSQEGISVTMTAVYSTSQAMMAGACGADFAAPYISHLDNMSVDGANIASEMARQLKYHEMKTEVLAASFRTASQVERCIAGGAGAVTVTAEMLDILASHSGTLNEIESFDKKWSARFGKNVSELI